MLKSRKYIRPYILNSIYNHLVMHYHKILIHKNKNIFVWIYGSYFKNMDDTIDGLQDKKKLLNINYKIIVFRNVILNHYLNG